MFFLTGVARYLFVPLAEAVVFAMLASYILSRTLVPTLAMYLLKPTHDQHGQRGSSAQSVRARCSAAFERGFERLRARYHGTCSQRAGRAQRLCCSCRCSCSACVASLLLVPWLGQDFFPQIDSRPVPLHLRAKTGTRIEETARLCDQVEDVHPREIPPDGAGRHPRQHRPALQRHQPGLQQLGADRRRPTPTSWSR